MRISLFQPLPLVPRRQPFSHPDWVFEIKFDGFRSLACVERGRTRLVSRNGNEFKSFAQLAGAIADELKGIGAVLDGELACLDENGCSQFKELLFRVAKHEQSRYTTGDGNPSWFKIRNRRYSQMIGRDELFERKYEATGAPEIGWSACDRACAASERISR